MNLLTDLRQWIGLLALCVLLVPPAPAAEVSGAALYEARVVVDDRSREARSEGIRSAGITVLTRITGERYPELHGELGPIVDRLEGLVERFRFESGDDGELALWVRFDPDAMDRQVRESGHPLWGRERPRTLVWLALRDGGNRSVLTEDEARERAPVLLEAARERGLPLLFPLMDLSDRGQVDFADIWAGFDEQVLEASGRYGPNAILIGRVDRLGGDGWSARWTLYQPDGVVRWRSSPQARHLALGDGIHETADRLAMRFAVAAATGGGDGLRLRIRGLDELEDYVAVERYLQGLTPVERIRLESLERDTAIFIVEARGGLRSLEQAIELGDRLVRVDPSDQRNREQGAMIELSPVEALPTYRLR
ncbi:DUF2066 domain-containing protein [Natronospira bacteriovora]|uniref:DUF2066 domain-containing protein n=1 Tax=Natronospira bacteriovora TaxID=3069753 RepID=A0ABU0W6R4_9GAMM|nr:DUF2066 domain-containing protein [Natronospira sp. AB-CW4]MDQ2069448.1 DUF2066 domain-containing protein [Natronospira sp. AB-CW4]